MTLTQLQASFRAALILSLFASMTATCRAQCPATGSTTVTPLAPASSTGLLNVNTANHTLMRDGVPFRPHGYNMIPFVASIYEQHQQPSSPFAVAYTNFNANVSGELQSMITSGYADTVRFQVSQPGVDPTNSNPNVPAQYDQAFCNKFVAGVQAARATGMNVIISMQNEAQSGGDAAPYPNTQTTVVWQMLSVLFKRDHGIMFEMYNEPQPMASTAEYTNNWNPKFEALAHAIRAGAPYNVLIADGLNYAIDLSTLVPLTETQVLYATHPYFQTTASQTQSVWDTHFGNLAASYPVIVTEWTTVAGPSSSPVSGTAGKYYCVDTTNVAPNRTTATAGLQMLQYLQSKGIGIAAYAYDFDGTLFGSAFYGTTTFTPSSWLNNPNCNGTSSSTGYGPGKTLMNWFQNPNAPISNTLQ